MQNSIPKPKKKRSWEDKLKEKVALVLKLAVKIYPERYVVLVPHPNDKQLVPSDYDNFVYQIYTEPKDNSLGVPGKLQQLVQQGHLEAMRRYLNHEVDCSFYRKTGIAYAPETGVPLPIAIST